MLGTKKRDYLSKLLEDQEYVANRYTMKCFSAIMLVFGVAFILDLLGIYVVEKRSIKMQQNQKKSGSGIKNVW